MVKRPPSIQQERRLNKNHLGSAGANRANSGDFGLVAVSPFSRFFDSKHQMPQPWPSLLSPDFQAHGLHNQRFPHISTRLQVLSRYSEFMNDSWLFLASMAMNTINFRCFLYLGLNSSRSMREDSKMVSSQHGHVPERRNEKHGGCRALNGCSAKNSEI